MSCRNEIVIQWQKKRNLKYATAVTYRIWTYTDNVRQAVLLSLFLRLVLVWTMNGFDRGAQLPVSRNPLSLLYGRWIFASSCQKSALPSQSGSLIFVWNASEWIKTVFFCLNPKPPLFTSVKTNTPATVQTHRVRGFRLNEKNKSRRNLRVSLSFSRTSLVCLCHMLYYDHLTVFRLL